MNEQRPSLPVYITVPISLVVIVLALVGEAPAGVRGALIGAAFAIPIPSLVPRPPKVWIHGALIVISMLAGAIISGFIWGQGWTL
ncbi:hypothetical protein CLV78_103148 [Aliiruegeria haliotis]|uniref:Uncharacterized protein n=1 Tax=Aliiruegeria haliotis TaxID=1280846 RepID=A0A2T0RT14_9RHOB|nr:hypothetical protein [Aliiruegeria haliotis]PRY24282.1 hypothetical protein CLV78_103148 [Aliiruegeria haliotis]